MKRNAYIPDHSAEALAEENLTSLLNLAFQQIEQEEMNMMRKEIQNAFDAPNMRQFEKKLSSRMRRERTKSALSHSLPRALRAVACIVVIIAIGAGMALALSQDARRWAAGVLTGTEVDDGFFTDPVPAKITDGTVYEDRLLLVENHEALSLREGTEAEPVRYTWKDRGARRLMNIEVTDGTIYALYDEGFFEEGFFMDEDVVEGGGTGAYKTSWGYFDAIGLGRIQLSQDGTFTVEPLAALDCDMLFVKDAKDCRLDQITSGNGSIYFTTTCSTSPDGYFGFGGKYYSERLFRIDLSNYALTELQSPTGGAIDLCYRLFGDGAAYVAVKNPARIYRIEADDSYTMMAEFDPEQHPNSYAYDSETDTLHYQLDSAAYAAAHFDISNARRAAITGGTGGRGALIGQNSYVIIEASGVYCEVFDLDAAPGDVTELIVGKGIDTYLSVDVRAQNPTLTLTEDPALQALYAEGSNADTPALYAQQLISDEAKADIVALDSEADAALKDAGWGMPIADEALRAEIDVMPEGVRNYVTEDGAYIGIPRGLTIYSDVAISPINWDRANLGDYPETWLELLEKLGAFSHSAEAAEFEICAPHPNMRQGLLALLADGFARSWKSRGADMDFGGADFRSALNAYADIDFDALKYSEYEGWSMEEQPLISLSGGGDYDPLYRFDFCDERTLKIHAEDTPVSRASCNIVRINPDTESEQEAYDYLRAAIQTDENYKFDRLRYDFETPAAELAAFTGGMVTTAQIMDCRYAAGDVWIFDMRYAARNRRTDAINAYLNGKITAEALAEQLNTIYGE